jgi:hypothetical protein
MMIKPRFFIFLIFLAVLSLPPASALDDTARESDSDFIRKSGLIPRRSPLN